jgi:hypothetical protein
MLVGYLLKRQLLTINILVQQFCHQILGQNAFENIDISISYFVESAPPRYPLVFVTTAGTDPSKQLRDFAKKNVDDTNYVEVKNV